MQSDGTGEMLIERPMVFHSPIAGDCYIMCRPTESISMKDEHTRADRVTCAFQISMRATDPRIYSSTLNTLLIPIGIIYFALYYIVFRVCIVRFGLPTPGRDAEETAAQPIAAGTRGASFVTALGGAGNLSEVAACTTRLRLNLIDNRAIDESRLKQLGSRGVLRSGATGLQVVLGPVADQVAGEIRAALRSGASGFDASAVLAALGGRNNVRGVEALAGRVAVGVAQTAAIDEGVLLSLGVRGIAHPSATSVQLLVAGSADQWALPLRRLLD